MASETSQFQCKQCMSPRNTFHVHITSKNNEVRKFQALERYGTRISIDITLEIRSQVKGHSRYGLEIFRGGVKEFNG